MRRILTAGLFVGVALLNVSPAAQAQTRDQQRDWCKNDDGQGMSKKGTTSDLAIGACTWLINSGQETTENLATSFMNRGAAYHNNGAYDRAIQDYDQAIKLKPDFAGAFVGRASPTSTRAPTTARSRITTRRSG